jgi:hypothetical protein
VACVAAVPATEPMVTDGGAGRLTLMVMAAVAVPCWESVTVSVTLAEPAAVGVPVMDEPLTCNPAGRPLADQVYGGVPPVAARA